MAESHRLVTELPSHNGSAFDESMEFKDSLTKPLQVADMSKAMGREKKVIKRKDFSTPSYNPQYGLVQKKLAVGTPSFHLMTGRKTMITEPPCKNIYDIREIYESIDQGKQRSNVDFKKMYGRNTLTNISTAT